MAFGFMLGQQLNIAIEEYFVSTREAEAARVKELHAALVIQKVARGFLTRRRLDILRNSVICIQKSWRGCLGRQRAHTAKEARDKRLRQEYFAAMATMIQRFWRGFWSRKYVFDFHARKLYLQRVSQINAQVRADLLEEGERSALLQKGFAEAAAQAAFNSKVSKLHHLLSTASQPGIFASPYALATGTIPVIAGAPVEEHLRTAFKKSSRHGSQDSRAGALLPPIKHTSRSTVPPPAGAVQQQGPHGAGEPNDSLGVTAADAAAPLKPEPHGTGHHSGPYKSEVMLPGLNVVVPRHLTLRQSVPYDSVRQAELLEAKVTKAEMLTLHPLPFMSATHKPAPPAIAVQSNRNMERYQDPWDPTLGARNEAFTPAQRSVSPQRFKRYMGHQPFFDGALNVDPTGAPPTTYHPGPLPTHAAGLTTQDMRRIARQPS